MATFTFVNIGYQQDKTIQIYKKKDFDHQKVHSDVRRSRELSY